MDRNHADAVAQAILAPDPQVQDALRRRRSADAARTRRQRRIAWSTLIGSAIGAAVAQLAGARFTSGVLWGGLAAAALCALVTRPAAA